MRLGILPSQQRALQQALKKARKFDDFRTRTRRGFLLAALGGCGASAAMFFLGRATAGSLATTEPAPSPALAPARKLATGPLSELVAAYPTFLLMLERAGADRTVWIGYARLVDVAVQRRDQIMARHLLQSGASPPPDLGGLNALLVPLTQNR